MAATRVPDPGEHDTRLGTAPPLVLDPSCDPTALRRAVAALTLDQLGCAWRSSDTILATTHDVRRHSQLASLRDLVLDEVERRRPRLYRRWLRDRGPDRHGTVHRP
jgi:hypothetical protein